MAKTILVGPDVDAGRALVEALDRAGFPVVAALWNCRESDPDEEGIWRLLVATPVVVRSGTTKTYGAIQEILLASRVDLAPDSISALTPDDPFVTLLRAYAGTDGAPFIGDARLKSSFLGNAYVANALVYRAQRLADAAGRIERWALTRYRARKVWLARRAVIATEGLFFKEIKVEGTDRRHARTRNGVTATLHVLANARPGRGAASGDVARWVILDGLLREVEFIARDVRVEGISESPAPANGAV